VHRGFQPRFQPTGFQPVVVELPPYSSNLNLIERLWKFVKKKCLWSKYYSNFKDFKEAIMDCLNQTHTTYKNELKSLLNLKFQSFKEAQVIEPLIENYTFSRLFNHNFMIYKD
jgi:transposase